MAPVCQQMLSLLKTHLFNLNLFEEPGNNDESKDNQQRHSRIIASRVYLVSLTCTLISIALVWWLRPQITIITVEQPTKDQFESIPVNAQCPCSRVSLSYGEFSSIQVSFHQVCASDFVSNRWITMINSGLNLPYLFWRDFRLFSSGQFQALASFCLLSKSNVNHSIALFALSTLLSPQVLTETLLRSRIQADSDQFQLTAFNTFTPQLNLVREMTRSNQLQSGLQTNVDLHYENRIESFRAIYSEVVNRTCDCLINVNCVFDSGIFQFFELPRRHLVENGSLLMRIPGFSTGCSPVDGILSSTLECFYNQTCLNVLISFYFRRDQFTAMTTAKENRFDSNSTVKSMLDRLMVEEWITNISYDKYYAQCAPISCTYSIVQRHSPVFVLTKMISLLSGLTLTLRLMIPVVVQYIQRFHSGDASPRVPSKYSE